MPDYVTEPLQAARYALRVSGEQVEHGLTENAFRFEASMSALTGQADLSAIHGLLIEHECDSDVCVDLRPPMEAGLPYRLVGMAHGSVAAQAMLSGVDVEADVCRGGILLLHHPMVIDIDSDKQPGTRLIYALQRHFAGRPLDVVLDLGTSEDDSDFKDYFFPDLDLLGLLHLSPRLARGRWGTPPPPVAAWCRFGVVYGRA